jgi:membrane-associated phospholipid phosphatase
VLPFLGAADFRRGTRAYAIGFAVCLLCYVALPASIHRPAVPDAGPSAAALAILYRHDPPVNVFPSFHATVAAVLYGLRGRGPWCSLGTGVWALAVCIACVLTKQHYVIDVVAGFLLGAIALRLASHVTKVDAGALRIGFAPPGPGRTPTVLPLRPTAP